MILHFKDHGAVAPGGLLPICAMKSSASSENFYWANLNKTCRLFLFKDSSTLSMLNTESNKWVTLSKMSKTEKGWRGIFGWLYLQIIKSPLPEGAPYILYYSNSHEQ
jgi:hypothetical protein